MTKRKLTLKTSTVLVLLAPAPSSPPFPQTDRKSCGDNKMGGSCTSAGCP